MAVPHLGTVISGLPAHPALQLLWAIALIGSCTSTVYLGMVLVAALRYARRSRLARARALSVSAAELPPVSILKPVYGMEPELEANLESFFRQDYREFEIVFGARNAQDEALETIDKLCARYPRVRTRVVFSGEPAWPNAKVFSLDRMIAAATHSYLVISDSDVRVGPDFLRNVVPPLLDPQVGLVTCLFRGIPTPHFWSRLDALGMSVETTSGVLVADMLEGMKFALGAVMAVRADALDAIGGIRRNRGVVVRRFCAGQSHRQGRLRGGAVALPGGPRAGDAVVAPDLPRSVALDAEYALLAA